jgi:hypothetical protein
MMTGVKIIERLTAMCVQEEERLESYNKNVKPQGKPKWDGSSSSGA